MLDNQLIAIFRSILISGLTKLNYSDIAVAAANQTEQQGANTAPTIYFYKLDNHLYGTISNYGKYDSITGNIIKTQTQWYETRFQINAFVTVNPADINAYTASDLLNAAAFVLQSDETVNTLAANDVGVYKISDVQNPYFVNEFGRYQATPSFDLTLTHKMTSQTIIPVVQSVRPGIHGV